MRLRLRGNLVRLLALAALLFSATARQANASAFTVLIFEQGPDVFAVGFGAIDVDEQVKFALDPPSDHAWVHPAAGGTFVGAPGTVDGYLALNVDQPTPFGPGGYTDGVLGIGDLVGIQPIGAFAVMLWVPTGYTSGAELVGTATYLGESIGSLGLTAGVYTYIIRNSEDEETGTFTVNVAPGAPVPEPTSLLLFGSGAAGLLVRMRRRKQ